MDIYIYLVHGSDDSMLLNCQFFPPWSMNSCNPNKSISRVVCLFWTEIDKLILKSIWKCKTRRINKTTFKKNKVRVCSDFNTQFKAAVIKTVYYCHKG